MKQLKKNGKYIRKCGRCGYLDDQSKMIKVSKRLSDNGWLCEDCYEETKYQDKEDDD